MRILDRLDQLAALGDRIGYSAEEDAAHELATGISMAWNGLSYTIAAELGGRRSGAAIGFQQTVLSAIGIAAPVAFAAMVSGTSWPAAFALASVFPLAGAWLLRPLAGH